MKLDAARLTPAPGEGLVARFAGVVLLTLPGPEEGEASLALVDLCRNVAGPLPGRAVARRLAAHLGTVEESVPAFCAVGETDTGLVVIVHGDIEASCRLADTDVLLSGRDAATWVDRRIDGPWLAVRAGVAAAEVVADPRFDVGWGVVPGAGFTLDAATGPTGGTPARPAGAEAVDPTNVAPGVGPPATPDARPPERARESVDFEAVLLVDAEADAEPDRAPLPIADEAPPAAEPEAPEGVQVQGILCPRQHFNNPEARFCAKCGRSLVQVTHNVVTGTRPPLGFLVFDDGSTYTLDFDYVAGREPEADERVRAGQARPLHLDDPQRSISRVHADIRLEGWRVLLVDRHSTNGTHVWDEATSAWTLLAADQPNPINSGARGAFGQRTFLYESPHEQRDRPS